jgi:hypothetical protein
MRTWNFVWDLTNFKLPTMTRTDTVPAGLEPAKVAESPPPAKENLPDTVPKDATPATTANIQYKIIKVRKPDGTIVRVKRPLTVEGMRSPECYMLLLLIYSSELSKIPSNASKANTGTKKKSSTASLPAKASNSEATPTKVTTKPSNEPAKENAPVLVQEPSTNSSGHTLKMVASGGRTYRGLSKFRHGSSRLAATFVPGWDNGDAQSDDEGLDDDVDDEDDEESDPDSDDDKGDAHKNNSSNVNQSHEGEHRTNDRAAKPVSTAVATEQAPATRKRLGAQSNTTAPNSKNAKKETPSYGVNDTIINEKEVSENDLESGASLKPIPSEMAAKNLVERYKHWSQYIVWWSCLVKSGSSNRPHSRWHSCRFQRRKGD